MVAVEHRFRGKTWIYGVGAGISGFFLLFALIMGPLYLSGVLNRADGRPARDAGIGLTAVGLGVLLPAWALSTYNFAIRRAPLLSIYREGVELKRVGRTSLDGVPMIPSLVRLAWSFLSLQGFRTQRLRIRWSSLRDVQVSGLPGMRILTVVGALEPVQVEVLGAPEPVAEQTSFGEAEFVKPLDRIADSIRYFASDEDGRAVLPSWDEPSLSR